MKRWLAAIPLALLVGLVAVAALRLTSDDPNTDKFASPKRPAPAIEAELLGGGAINFAELDGPVLVNFWAPWCTPCKAEHPVFMRMQEEGVPILGVLHMDMRDKQDVEAAVERGKALLARDGNPFVNVPIDPTGDVSLEFGITGVPETFLVDADGQIVKTSRGPIVDVASMNQFINAWRAEAGLASD